MRWYKYGGAMCLLVLDPGPLSHLIFPFPRHGPRFQRWSAKRVHEKTHLSSSVSKTLRDSIAIARDAKGKIIEVRVRGERTIAIGFTCVPLLRCNSKLHMGLIFERSVHGAAMPRCASLPFGLLSNV